MAQLDPRAFDSSIDFSPLLGALQNYRKGMGEEYKWKGQQALGSALANKDYQGASAAAGQYGMDPSVLMQVGEFGRQAQERDRQAEAFKDPRLMQGISPQHAAALATLAPEQRAAALAQAYNPLTKAQIDASRASTAHAYGQESRAQAMAPYDLNIKRIQAQSAQREFDTPKPTTFDLGEGHTRFDMPNGPDGRPMRNPDGTLVVRKVAEGGAKINATTQKAIDEADDFTKQSTNAVGAIKEALRLNSTAYDGVGANARAAIVNNIPGVGGTQSSLATTDLNNLITNQALSALRATFGGNPTEGERKILLEVQGSTNLPAAARKVILDRALQAAQQSLQFNQQKGQALREGKYYQPGGQPEAARTPMNFGPPQGQQGQPTPLPAAPQAPQVSPGGVYSYNGGTYRFKGGNPADPASWERAQ
jgi:hypothetical protein